MYKKAQLVSARLCFHFPSIVSMSFSLNRTKMYLFRQWLIKVALSFAFHLSLFSGFTEILPSLGPGRSCYRIQFRTPLLIFPTSQVRVTAAQTPFFSAGATRMPWRHVGFCYPITKENCRLPALDMDI